MMSRRLAVGEFMHLSGMMGSPIVLCLSSGGRSRQSFIGLWSSSKGGSLGSVAGSRDSYLVAFSLRVYLSVVFPGVV